jgi:hypothetical protein
LIQDGKVLKITLDKDELTTSASLINNKLKHIVQIYRVFKLTSLPDFGFILQEKLNPLSSKEEEDVNKLDLHGTDTITSCRSVAKKFKFRFIKDIKDYLRYTLGDPYTINKKWESAQQYLKSAKYEWDDLSSEVKAFIAKTVFYFVPTFGESTLNVIDKNLPLLIEIFKSLDELADHHIHFIDTHGGNLMKDNKGNLKWIDLGYRSKGEHPGKIEEVEGAKHL